MNSLKFMILAVVAFSRKQASNAFITPSLSTCSFGTVMMQSSRFDGLAPAPNDESIREEYSRWRQKYSKGDFDPVRYENFKANFLAVTVRNNMERSRARQNGESAPSPIQLNEYGDCSSGEYRQAMNQQQNNRNIRNGPNRTSSNAGTKTMSNSRGLQPSNTVIGNRSTARRRED